jgi:putative DNA primase/helicase
MNLDAATFRKNVEELEAQHPESVPSEASVITINGDFGTSKRFVEEFLAGHNIEHRGPIEHNGAVKYVLNECPFNQNHKNSAVFVYRSGARAFKCFHDSCSGKTWKEFKEHFDPHKSGPRASSQSPNSSPPEDSDELELICCADIKAIPIQWLWPGRIALKKITTLAGMPGLGKTQLLMQLAAIITTGGKFPVTSETAPAGSVVVMSGEDGAEDTLLPRLLAAGGDRNKVHILKSVLSGHNGDGSRAKRMLSLERDIATIGKALAALGDARLVIIDPISAYMGRRLDSHNNTDVRGVLAPLAELAEAHNVAIVLNTHLSKAKDPDAMMRVTGSIAFVAAARAAWLVAKDKEDPGRRLFLPLKNNLAPDHGNGLSYTIEGLELDDGNGQVATSRIVWGSEFVSTTADDAMKPHDKRGTAKGDAEEWLKQELSSGPVASSDLFRRGEAAGHSQKTLYRAKDSLGIVARKGIGIEHGGWSWRLPEDIGQDFDRRYAPHKWNPGQDDEVDHLRQQAYKNKRQTQDGQVRNTTDHLRTDDHLDLMEEEI